MQTPYGKAEAFLRRSRYELAVPMLREVLASEPDHPKAGVLLALALTKLYRPDEGEKQARRALDLQPNNSLAHYALALALNGLHKYKEAIAHANEALRLSPGDVKMYSLIAVIHLDRENYLAALAECNVGLSLRSDDYLLRLISAHANAGMKKKVEALKILARCLQAKPDDPHAYGCAGWIHYLLGDYPQAEEYYEKALSMGPMICWAHGGMGMVRVAQSRPEEARPLLEEALRLNPYYRKARKALAKISRKSVKEGGS
jgi:tetratricopeptide (TPR) repeat protein